MNSTPNANRKHIAIFGSTNAGKSSLLNAIIGQEVSIVSDVKGTTTDPVTKSMELIPFGPVVFIDTAGLNDTSELGSVRIKRTRKVLQSTDFAIYVMDASESEDDCYASALEDYKKYKIPHMLVINKIDLVSAERFALLKETFCNAVFVTASEANAIEVGSICHTRNAIEFGSICQRGDTILDLKDVLIKRLSENEIEETIIGDILPAGSRVIMVIPVDSEAPKGRIILPQMQLLRDCLDHGIKSYVVRDTELVSALEDLKDIDMVVTDSQAFKFVNSVVPASIKLTSFSILFARYKGDLKAFVDGVHQVRNLKDGSRILIAESCTHNHSHEDIGRVKIPKLLSDFTQKKLVFEFKMGQDFPEELGDYDLVIHCGSCMLNKKIMQTRVDTCADAGVSITNYGVILAYLNGILDKSVEMFGL